MKCPVAQNHEGWYCPQCGWIYRGDRRPTRTCPRSPDLQPAADRLGLTLADVQHYAAALARWLRAGMPERSAAEVARIHAEHCLPCEHLVAGRCDICRCRVNDSGLALVNKIAMATEHCPAGHW